jgi:hypothetical protein
MVRTRNGIVLCLAMLLPMVVMAAGTVIRETGESRTVFLGADGRLVYAVDAKGNRLPDFSYVGYHLGERAIPDVPVQVTLQPIEGDNTAHIQAAIDRVGATTAANRVHGAVLLKRGTYRVEGRLQIRHSGVVLRGEGAGPDGTVLVAAGYGDRRHKRAFITVGNNDRIKVDQSSRREIEDSFVPIGAHAFTIASATGYRVGDRIVLYRPSTKAWIQAIGMDRIPPRWGAVSDLRWERDGDAPGLYYQRAGISGHQRYAKNPGESWEAFMGRLPISADHKRLDFTRQWEPGTYDFHFERTIIAINGNTITIDAPNVHPLDQAFGGGAIFKYDAPDRVYEVGIENLYVVSEFAKPEPGHPYGNPKVATQSEDHAWNAIVLARNSENIWVRNVTGNYFGWSLISASGQKATVTDCVNLGHASRIEGGRRYPFMINGQLNLMQRCVAFEGRHEFVNQQRTPGPNVFVDCVGFDSKGTVGPHHRYAIGNLYDNVKSEQPMESRDRGSSGTGHGWAGTQTCFYNCVAPQFLVGAPPGGIAWVIGSGTAQGQAARVLPPSLYYQQLQDRLGEAAVNRLATPEQHRNMGQYRWVQERLRVARGET